MVRQARDGRDRYLASVFGDEAGVVLDVSAEEAVLDSVFPVDSVLPVEGDVSEPAGDFSELPVVLFSASRAFLRDSEG